MLSFLFIISNFFFQPMEPMDEIEQLMAFNQYWDAYKALNQLISKKGNKPEPKMLRLRATCELKMTMPKECIADCSQILKMKASNDDLRTALVLRASAHLQLGEFDAATKDAKSASDQKTLRNIQDAIRISKNAENFINNGQISEGKKSLDQLLRLVPKAGKYQFMRADIAWMEEDYQKYDELTKDISDDYANDPKLQYRRGIIKLCDDKLDEADSLLRKSSKQKKAPKNATVAVNAINAIRTNRAQANAYITKKDQEKAEVFLNKTIESSRMFCSAKAPLVQSTNLLTIKLLKMKNDKHQIIEVLDEMISANPTDMDLILERGDLHLELGDYDAAIFDYNNVQSHNPQNRRAHEGLQKAAEMKKAANHVDYYKLLGVSNSATTEEIKKAYRKLVVQWHPDRQREKEKKQEAEEMMKKINTAYEILCDPQRRRMYDQGIDPDDPMSGPGDDFFSEGFDPFDLLKQTMGGDPFEFMFGGGGGGGGQEFHFEGGQGFQFGGDGFQFHFNF